MKIIKGNYTLTFLHCLGSFEKLMQKQIVGYIENVLSPYLYGYVKSYINTQQALITKVLQELC